MLFSIAQDRSGIDIRFGIAKGFFAEEGLDITVRVIFGGPEIAAAYDSGELKIGELGTPPGITAMGHGARFKIIASGLPGRVGLFFMVDPDVGGWHDLRGRTLGALSIGSCSYWYLRELLLQHGLEPDKDVHIRGLNNRLFALPREISARAITRERPTVEFEGKIDEPGLEKAIWLQHRLGAIPKMAVPTEMLASQFLS